MDHTAAEIDVTPEAENPAEDRVPLCVALEGGLLRSDILFDAVFELIRRNPRTLFRLPLWLIKGKEVLRRETAARVDLDVSHLPFRDSVLERVTGERERGRRLVLVTNGFRAQAEAVAEHVGLFDEVLAPPGEPRGGSPASVLIGRFGTGGFDFLGGSKSDLATNDAARAVVVADGGAPSFGIAEVLEEIRIHQWLKNLLIFLPVLAAQQLNDGPTLVRAAIAFVAFSLAASSVYVLNDLLDLQADRKHSKKRNRPFASGRLPYAAAPLLSGALLTVAAGASLAFLPLAFTAALSGYLVLSLSYSLKLKDTVLLDVMTLAGLYTLRVIAGAAATGITLSVWLLGFCLFFFLSLALVKRYAELHSAIKQLKEHENLPGRSYRAIDLPVLVGMGVACGCISALVLALYTISDQFAQHYTRPYLLWQLCPLTLYWIGRAWIVVARNEMHSDPLIWAVKDEMSRWVAVIAVAILVFAR